MEHPLCRRQTLEMIALRLTGMTVYRCLEDDKALIPRHASFREQTLPYRTGKQLRVTVIMYANDMPMLMP